MQDVKLRTPEGEEIAQLHTPKNSMVGLLFFTRSLPYVIENKPPYYKICNESTSSTSLMLR